MTEQTPVALWEPALARRSMPNGMPLLESSEPREATILDARAVKGLFSSADALVWRADPYDASLLTFELYPDDAPTLIATPSMISYDLLAAYAEIGQANRTVSVRYVTTLEPLGVAGPAVGLSGASVRESLEHLRRDLGLSARVLASLIGVSTRRYYEIRAGDEPPAARLADVRNRVEVIKSLATRDMSAAAELFRRHSTVVAGLLTEDRFAEIDELFRKTVRERATTLSQEEWPNVSGPEANELLAVIEQPAFRKILQIVRHVAPTVDARTSDRVAAALRMDLNIRAVEDGEPPEDDWEFLLVMRPEAINDLRGRAEEVIRAETFAQKTWTAFVTGESERAWAAFDYRPTEMPGAGQTAGATPDLDAADWHVDLARLGIDLSLYDRRTR